MLAGGEKSRRETDQERGFSLTRKQALATDMDLEVVVVDVTEHPIERPKKQRAHYSGKKKRHTLKSQWLIHQASGQMLSLQIEKRKVHDFR